MQISAYLMICLLICIFYCISKVYCNRNAQTLKNFTIVQLAKTKCNTNGTKTKRAFPVGSAEVHV